MGKKYIDNSRKGFTLLELTIVMIVIALLTVGTIKSYNMYGKWKKIETTNVTLDKIDIALANYVKKKGHYPCPAPINAKPSDIHYSSGTDCTAPPVSGVTPVAGAGGREVRIGALPSRALGFADSYIGDGWDQIFSYAVTTDLAKSRADFENKNGGITIKDTNDVMIANGNAHYVVLSAGPDSKGAHNGRGNKIESCNAAAAADKENCDNTNATFVIDPKNRAFTSGPKHFDDFGSYRIFSETDDLWRVLRCHQKYKFYDPKDPKADADDCICPSGQTADSSGKCVRDSIRSGYKLVGSKSINLRNLRNGSGTLKYNIPANATDLSVSATCSVLGRNALASISVDFKPSTDSVGKVDFCGLRGTKQGESTGDRYTVLVPIPPDAKTLELPYQAQRLHLPGTQHSLIAGTIRFFEKQ